MRTDRLFAVSPGRRAPRQRRGGVDSRQLLWLLGDSVSEAIVLLDGDHRVLKANANGERLLEEHGEIRRGRLVGVAGRTTDELLGPGGDEFARQLESGGGVQRVLRVKGRRFSDSSSDGAMLIIQDLTSEREVAERVARQARLAAVGELAAGVAHDINNLLQGISGLAESLRDLPDLPPRAREDVESIVDQAAIGSRVTRRLLDFSRQSPVTRRVVDLGELLGEICPLLERALPVSIRLQLNLPTERLAVLADHALIQQLVANLVINARDAMPDGGWVVVAARRSCGVEARRRPCAQLPDARWIELTIADCGSGMPPEVQARAFEPFFTTKARGVGTGLGLSQAASIVRQHDGYIELESRPDRGTTVRAYLPECLPRTLTMPVLAP